MPTYIRLFKYYWSRNFVTDNTRIPRKKDDSNIPLYFVRFRHLENVSTRTMDEPDQMYKLGHEQIQGLINRPTHGRTYGKKKNAINDKLLDPIRTPLRYRQKMSRTLCRMIYCALLAPNPFPLLRLRAQPFFSKTRRPSPGFFANSRDTHSVQIFRRTGCSPNSQVPLPHRQTFLHHFFQYFETYPIKFTLQHAI